MTTTQSFTTRGFLYEPAEPVALGDALRWSKATESHGAYVFTPAQLRVFYEYATRAAPPAQPAGQEPTE